jgi:hypothetical protein
MQTEPIDTKNVTGKNKRLILIITIMLLLILMFATNPSKSSYMDYYMNKYNVYEPDREYAKGHNIRHNYFLFSLYTDKWYLDKKSFTLGIVGNFIHLFDKNKYGTALMQDAVIEGKSPEEMLVESSPKPTTAIVSIQDNPELNKELNIAVEAKDLEKIKQLLGKGANPNATSADHAISIPPQAVNSGDIKVLTALYEAGMDVNWEINSDKKSDESISLLMLAVGNVLSGSSQVVNQVKDVVMFLLDHGADVNHLSADRSSALSYAMKAYSNGYENKQESMGLIEILINAGTNLNYQDNDGNTPLMFYDSFDVIIKLLKAGADPTIKNNKGDSFLELTRKSVVELGGLDAALKESEKNGNSDQVLQLITALGIDKFKDIKPLQQSKGNKSSEGSWQNYVDDKYGYRVRFPSEWISKNGSIGFTHDLNTDSDNYIFSIASTYKQDFSTDTTGYSVVTLKNSDIAHKLIENVNGIVKLSFIYITGNMEYGIYGQVSESFYNKYKDQINEMMNNFETTSVGEN